MSALFELRRALLASPDKVLFQDLDWRARRGVVTALLGPAGGGKSALLRLLAGQPPLSGWRLGGTWLHGGRALHSSARDPDHALAWLPQAARGGGVSASAAWRAVLAKPARTLLLDEPSRGLVPEDAEALAAALRRRAPEGGVLLVTHDLAFARHAADDVALLCAGSLIASGPAARVFEAPPNELAARFLRQGNSWPAPNWPPPLPSHFRWLLPQRLAGMARPGLLGDVDTDLEAIAARGVRLLVTLTEDPFPAEKLRAVGLVGRHFPVPDMGVPAVSSTASLCREIERCMAEAPVVLHCRAGAGRTGTLLAAMLVWLGEDPEAAIRTVRSAARGYIQTATQLDFVKRFAEAVGRRRE